MISRTIRHVNPLNITNTFHMARLMDKNKMAAARIRARYLKNISIAHKKLDCPVADLLAKQIDEEIKTLLTKGKASVVYKGSDLITHSDIATARDHPIDSLVEFINGKTIAWCHEDKNPTMFHGTRTNRAVCPACNKSFDSIGVLMERDGYSFANAVKALR